MQSADLYVGSHSISYWVPDSVSDSIPDWVSDSNSYQVPNGIPIPHFVMHFKNQNYHFQLQQISKLQSAHRNYKVQSAICRLLSMQALNLKLGSRFSFRFNSRLGFRFKFRSSSKCNSYSSFSTSFQELELTFLLQKINCNLQTVICKLQSANCNLKTAICEKQFENCNLQTAICKLQYENSNYNLQIAICRLITRQLLNFILSSRFSFRLNSRLGFRLKFISSSKCNSYYSFYTTTFQEIKFTFLAATDKLQNAIYKLQSTNSNYNLQTAICRLISRQSLNFILGSRFISRLGFNSNSYQVPSPIPIPHSALHIKN